MATIELLVSARFKIRPDSGKSDRNSRTQAKHKLISSIRHAGNTVRSPWTHIQAPVAAISWTKVKSPTKSRCPSWASEPPARN